MDPDHVASPTLVPTAGVAILDAVGQILLGRRSDDGSWSLPGGKLEPGESFADCAHRECREELGHEVGLHGIIAVLSNPKTQTHRYPDGRTKQFVGLVFRGTLGAKVGEGDGEFTEVDWFAGHELNEAEIMAADLPGIRHALSAEGKPLID